jgi:hypothetical protein
MGATKAQLKQAANTGARLPASIQWMKLCARAEEQDSCTLFDLVTWECCAREPAVLTSLAGPMKAERTLSRILFHGRSRFPSLTLCLTSILACRPPCCCWISSSWLPSLWAHSCGEWLRGKMSERVRSDFDKRCCKCVSELSPRADVSSDWDDVYGNS